MEIVKMVTKKVEELFDIKCDCCGKSCNTETHPDGSKSFEYMELKGHWGFNSKKDLEMWQAHLCEKCVDEKLGFIKFNITPMQIGVGLKSDQIKTLKKVIKKEVLKKVKPEFKIPIKSTFRTQERQNLLKILGTFKTQYKEGFTRKEMKELLKKFPTVTEAALNNALGVNTAIMRGGHILTFKSDVELALRCCIEKRGKTSFEFD
jgi:hypothetical protein